MHLSLDGPEIDSIIDTDVNETFLPAAGVSLLDPATSAADLRAAVESLPFAGAVSVTRVPAAGIGDPSVSSRHLVTFLTRGGDVPLLKAEAWTVNTMKTSHDDTTDIR